MVTLITIVHVVVCIFLILTVLLQTGKGAGMGAAFGGSSQTVFGGSGAGTFLSKLTTITAAVFMLTSMTLAFFSSSQDSSGLQKRSQQAKSAPALPHPAGFGGSPTPATEKPGQGTAPVKGGGKAAPGAAAPGSSGPASTAPASGAPASTSAAPASTSPAVTSPAAGMPSASGAPPASAAAPAKTTPPASGAAPAKAATKASSSAVTSPAEQPAKAAAPAKGAASSKATAPSKSAEPSKSPAPSKGGAAAQP